MKTYIRHKIYNALDVKELIALEPLDFEGKYRDYVENHDFWELCYTLKGEILLLLEEKSIPVAQQHLVLIPPNKKHAYRSYSGNQNQAFVICFDGFSQVLDAISGHVFSPDAVQTVCMDNIMSEFSDTFRMNELGHLEILPEPRFGGQQALLLQLEYLLIHLIRTLSVKKNSDIIFFSDKNFHADLTKVILRFLRENVDKKISLDDVCGRFSYSKSFLCKIFKEQTGETLISCVNRLKMEEAQRLLRETTQPIANIAWSLGFKEVKYFDFIFKKHTGFTPIAYRGHSGKSNNNDKENPYEQRKEN